MEYKILILPNIKSLPLETMEFIEKYAREGGIVIALERVPDSSVGLADYALKDNEVKSISENMFREPSGRRSMGGTAPHDYGKGRTYNIKNVIYRTWGMSDMTIFISSVLDPFVNTLRDHVTPDFGIDFAHEGIRQNKGLTFVHRRKKVADKEIDIYFVTNIQERPSNIPITFRVKGKLPWKWNPYNGTVSRVFRYHENTDGTEVLLHLAPYESTFIVFSSGQEATLVTQSTFYDIANITGNKIEALAAENGTYEITIKKGDSEITRHQNVTNIPGPYVIDGTWKLTMEGTGFPRMDTTITRLSSWTKNPATRHFSGAGRYEILFELPVEYRAGELGLKVDLGKVGNVAEVELNGKKIGTVWMRGQTLDATDAVKAGKNRMVVIVTNMLINRISGLKEAPPVPEELIPSYGRGNPMKQLQGHSAYSQLFKPLPASGLLGPVRLIAMKKISLYLERR